MDAETTERPELDAMFFPRYMYNKVELGIAGVSQ